MYDILSGISVGHGRLDEALAWKMRRYELDPENTVVACQVAGLLDALGFREEARLWSAKSNEGRFYYCFSEHYFECSASREAYLSERCKTHRLERAQGLIGSDYATATDWIRVFKYREAIYLAQTSDRPDLVRKWLDEALEWLGTGDPVAILAKNPKRLVSARHEGLDLVPVFRDLGLDEAAERMLTLCERDPADPEQIVFRMDTWHYVDARHRSLAGDKAEAMALLERAVGEHQTYLGRPSPDRWDLMFDRALDPLREDPAYAPRLERLIKEYYDWMAPARERTAKALETGDWASLRTLLDEDSTMLAASPTHAE